MEKSDFTHVLITRFNIDFGGLYATKYGGVVRDEEWLIHRFKLFSEYCYPSVQFQTNQGFKWLVFFDSKTPQGYKDKVEELKFRFVNFHPVYISSGALFLPAIMKYVAEEVVTPFIITSRLDNDDVLHKVFISKIQENFKDQVECLIDVPNGMQLNLEQDQVSLVRSYNPFGPFISLIEKTDKLRSVYHFPHKTWRGKIKQRVILNEKLWIQLIHEKNILNSFKGRRNYKVDIECLTDFGVEDRQINSLKTRSTNNRIIHNLMAPFFKSVNLGLRGVKKLTNLFKGS